MLFLHPCTLHLAKVRTKVCRLHIDASFEVSKMNESHMIINVVRYLTGLTSFTHCGLRKAAVDVELNNHSRIHWRTLHANAASDVTLCGEQLIACDKCTNNNRMSVYKEILFTWSWWRRCNTDIQLQRLWTRTEITLMWRHDLLLLLCLLMPCKLTMTTNRAIAIS